MLKITVPQFQAPMRVPSPPFPTRLHKSNVSNGATYSQAFTSTENMLEGFHLYPYLPRETRLQIWELAAYPLPPQIIPLELQHHLSHSDIPPTHLADYVTLMDYNRNQDIWARFYTTNIEPSEILSILLSTCAESRAVAFRMGYKKWTLKDKKYKIKDVIWNPNIDVVAIVGKHDESLVRWYLSVSRSSSPPRHLLSRLFPCLLFG